jgi:hypothetical protein
LRIHRALAILFSLSLFCRSVLKALGGLRGVKMDWNKVHLFYVNHKCLANDDPKSTHKKVRKS